MSRTESDRTTALKQLSHFRRRILPGALRRIASWKGIPRPLLRDWLDDVVQELAVDCLEHAGAIVDLPERDRHARWMRRAEKVIYRHRRNMVSQQLAVEEPTMEACPPSDEQEVQIPPLVALNNGRANVIASIRETGMARRDLRRQLDALAAKLGWDAEQQSFWQARAVEALTGLAADLLQEQGAVRLIQPSTTPPDSDRRRARLHRLSSRFPVQPSTRNVRRALRPWVRRRSRATVTPRTLLEQAVALQPESTAAWLWLFEACCWERDSRAASRAIRAVRAARASSRVAIVLARARLLEMRGKMPAAFALLRRCAARWPRDHDIQKALAVAMAA